MERDESGQTSERRSCGRLAAIRKRRLWLSIPSAVVACLAVIGCVVPPAVGQAPGVPAMDVANRFLPPPRALLQHLSRGREAIRNGQWNVAVEELGAVLAPDRRTEAEADIDQDYFLQDSQTGTASSLRQEAQKLIGALPPAGRRLYELRFGAEARALLAEAVRQNDVTKFTEVIRRYLHTEAGYQAMLILARRYLDAGKPSAALLCLDRLLALPEARRQLDPELSLLAAFSHTLLGETAPAAQLLVDVRSRYSGHSLYWGPYPIPALNAVDQARAWLADKLPTQPADQRVTGWLMHRGSPSRNAQSTGGMLVRSPRWWVPVTNDPQDEQLLVEQQRQSLGGSARMPSIHPLAVDNVVLMRTTNRLLAVDLTTGKRIWEFPWDESADEEAAGSLQPNSGNPAGSLRAMELLERLWKDAPYGQLASDGQRVFALHDLSYALWVGNPTLVVPQGLVIQNPKFPRTENKLVALDLARQGALVWIVGGPDGGDEPALAKAFFLGAPLPAMGQLFVLAEIAGELRLVVLDPANGGLLWQQQLAHVDTLTIDQDPLRRLAGATPSYADGVLVCPTSAGAVVAIDIATRSLLWGFRYPTKQVLQPFPRAAVVQSTVAAETSEDTWVDASVTIADGRVVVTPVESDELYCLNLLDGSLAWPARKRDGAMYVACIHQGKIVLVGQNFITALSLADGSLAWPTPLALRDETVIGRGFYVGQWYYLPTSASRLLKIDLESGTVVESAEVRGPLGNVICHRDQVLALGPKGLASYYQLEALEQWVQARLAVDPNDREALIRKCDLLLQRGERRQALDIMWTIYQNDPQDEATRRQLVETYLSALDVDFAEYLSWREKIEPLIDQASQRGELLRKLVVGLEAMGRWDEAFEALLRLADQYAAEPAAGEVLEQLSPQWSVRPRRWVQGRLAALLAAVAGPEYHVLRQKWEAHVRLRLDRVLQLGSRPALRQFIELFDPHPVTRIARQRYAQMLLENGEFLAAELQLTPLLDEPLETSDPRVLILLAELYLKLQRFDAAARCLAALEQLDPSVPLEENVTVGTALDNLRRLPAYARFEELHRPWPYGAIRSRVEQNPATTVIGSLYFPAQVDDSHGLWPRGATVTLDMRSNSVTVRDGWGNLMQQALLHQSGPQFSSMYSLAKAKAVGHLLVVSVQTDLLVIDALRSVQDPQDAVLWRSDLAELTPNMSPRRINQRPLRHPWNQNGTRVVLSDFSPQRVPLSSLGPVTPSGVCYQRFRQLVCADPLTGEIIWTRDGMEHGAQLFGDDQYLFVVGYDKTEALVLRTATGELVGRRPAERMEFRWTTWGTRVLAWQEEGTQLAMRIYDAWTGQEFWRELFPIGSRAELIDDDKVAVFRPNGQLVVASLREGRLLWRSQLEPVAAPSYLVVHATRDVYYMLPGSVVPPNARGMLLAPPGTATSPILRGYLYALDAQSGKPIWPTPALIDGYAVPLQSRRHLPILPLVRAQRSDSTITAALLCLDKRDGRALYENPQLPLLQPNLLLIDASTDPSLQQVRLQLGLQTVELQWTGEPIPPAPPYQPKSDNRSVSSEGGAR